MTVVSEKLESPNDRSRYVEYGTNDNKNILKIQQNEALSFLQPTFAPKMMSLEKFLEPFDKSVLTDKDIAQKYSAYIASFIKEQLSDQFDRHKNSAWFQDKYHPDYMRPADRKSEAIVDRFRVFHDMLKEGCFNKIALEVKNNIEIIKLLDKFAIKLAGGSEAQLAELESFDFKSVLAQKPPDEPPTINSSSSSPRSVFHQSPSNLHTSKISTDRSEKVEPKRKTENFEEEDASSSDSSSSSSSSSSGEETTTSASTSASDQSDQSDNDDDLEGSWKPQSTESETVKAFSRKEDNSKTNQSSFDPENLSSPKRDSLPLLKPLHFTRVLFIPYLPLSIHRATVEKLFVEHPDFLRFACLDPTPIPAPNLLGDPLAPSVRSGTGLVVHRPAWVTFTAEPVSNASENVLTFCQQLIERLSNESELEDLVPCLAAARILSSPFCTDRVRASSRLINSVTPTNNTSNRHPVCTKKIMRRHLVMAARLAYRLDEVNDVWKNASRRQNQYETDAKRDNNQSPSKENAKTDQNNDSRFSIPKLKDLDPEDNIIAASSILSEISANSINPLLDNLTDYLIDEGGTEEELFMLGAIPNYSHTRDSENDDELALALDRLILYLRLVFSVDFYAPMLNIDEHEMPHPCGIIHVRPSVGSHQLPPPELVFSRDRTVNSAYRVFAHQLCRLFRLLTPISATDGADMEIYLKRLGFRDPEEAAEAFIKANTKRRKRKVDIIWVCPLSDKKFRDPIFVRKHILNKHMDQIESAKKENAHFFNNFLADEMRPELMKPPNRRLPIKDTNDTSDDDSNAITEVSHRRRRRRSNSMDDKKRNRMHHKVSRSPETRFGRFNAFQHHQQQQQYTGNTRYWNRGGNNQRGYRFNHRRGANHGSRDGPSRGNGFYRSNPTRSKYIDLDAPY